MKVAIDRRSLQSRELHERLLRGRFCVCRLQRMDCSVTAQWPAANLHRVREHALRDKDRGRKEVPILAPYILVPSQKFLHLSSYSSPTLSFFFYCRIISMLLRFSNAIPALLLSPSSSSCWSPVLPGFSGKSSSCSSYPDARYHFSVYL